MIRHCQLGSKDMTRFKTTAKIFPIVLLTALLGVSALSAAEVETGHSNLDNYLICSEGISLEHNFDITDDSYTFPNGLVAEKLEDRDGIVLSGPEDSDIPTTYIDSYKYLGNNLYLVFRDVDGFTASGLLSSNGNLIYSTRDFFNEFNQYTQVKPLIFDKSTQITYFTTFEKGKNGIVTTDEEKDAAITMLGVLLADCMDNKEPQVKGLFTELLDNGFMIYAVKNNQIGIASIDADNHISVKQYYDSIEPIYTYDVSLEQIKTKDPLKIFTEVEDVLYKVEKNGKYGLMDRDYNIRIPIEYDNLTRMDDFIKVTLDEKEGLFTTHGEPYIDIDYDNIMPIYYRGQMADSKNYVYDNAFFHISLMKDNNITLTDYFGDEFLALDNASLVGDGIDLVDGVFSSVELDGTMSFSHQTQEGSRNGVIDLVNQKILLPAIYSDISQELPNNTYAATLEGKPVLINENGEVLSDKLPNVHSSYTALNDTNHILVTTSDDHQGVIDTKGNIVIPIIYDSIELYMFDDEVGYKATLNQEDTFFDSKGVSREPQ